MNAALFNGERRSLDQRRCRTPDCTWKHHSRFRSWRPRGRNGSVSTSIKFSPFCRDCEQKERNERKNEDRPRAIIENRAKAHAAKFETSFEFLWTHMRYDILIPRMRALLADPDALCDCGHKFLNERDIQIEHREPPRHNQDWARLHVGNLDLICAACNAKKGKKPYHQWLDEQEEARLSNLVDQEALSLFHRPEEQFKLPL